jgi:hypothetical protein
MCFKLKGKIKVVLPQLCKPWHEEARLPMSARGYSLMFDDMGSDARRKAAMHAWPGLGIVYHPFLAEAGACVLRVITALLIVHQRCGSVLRARAPRAIERVRARTRARAAAPRDRTRLPSAQRPRQAGEHGWLRDGRAPGVRTHARMKENRST